jgi:hypothetical protein
LTLRSLTLPARHLESVTRQMAGLNHPKFREDPDAMLVMSLEEYDDITGKAEKAAIIRLVARALRASVRLTEVAGSESVARVGPPRRGVFVP